jgi:hypothetical protein
LANVAHSTLTGSNLHENKGVAAATNNHVATATSGATVWKKLDNTNLAALGNPFGANLLHIAGGAGATTANGENLSIGSVITNEIASASVAGNVITLPAGTYFTIIHAKMNASNTTTISLTLRNDSTATTLFTKSSGASVVVPTDGTNPADLIIFGRFTTAGSHNIVLRGSSNFTDVKDTSLLFWRVA